MGTGPGRIDVTVITDSSAAHLMRTWSIDAVIVGADRITRDAVFNKIGTYMHAICARITTSRSMLQHRFSTFDTQKERKDVIIEERGREEVTTMGSRKFVPDDAAVKNYAFDATPIGLVTAIITERVCSTHPLPSTPFILEEDKINQQYYRRTMDLDFLTWNNLIYPYRGANGPHYPLEHCSPPLSSSSFPYIP